MSHARNGGQMGGRGHLSQAPRLSSWTNTITKTIVLDAKAVAKSQRQIMNRI